MPWLTLPYFYKCGSLSNFFLTCFLFPMFLFGSNLAEYSNRPTSSGGIDLKFDVQRKTGQELANYVEPYHRHFPSPTHASPRSFTEREVHVVRDAARNAEPLRPELLRVLEVLGVGLQRVDGDDDADARVDGDLRAWQRVGADAAARQESQGWVETHALSGRC